MPKIILPVPETTESITRPVMLDIVRQVMEITGISSKTNLVYFGDVEKSKQLNSAISQMEGDDPNKFAHNDKISIEVNEVFDTDRIPNEVVFGPQNLLVFEDPPLDIIMKPVYATMDASITVRYRSNNKNQAIQWRNHMKAKISQRRDINIHDITYSFGIPNEFLYILKELHRLRENVAGYGDTFDDYFASNRHPKITKLTNQSGAAELWVVPETQTRVQGWFDFELPDEATKDGDGDTFSTTFTYKFRYDRPDNIAMVYPIMVHNQLLDQRFRDSPVKDQDDMLKSYAMGTRVLVASEAGHAAWDYTHRVGYSMPTFDEFLPKMIPLKTLRVLTILFTISDTNSSHFMNLQNLGSRKFSPEIVAYLKAECAYLTKPQGSLFTVSLYRNEFLVEPTPLQIDADLNVVGLTDINLRVQNHIRISLTTDLYFLRGNALTRLQEHGQAALQILAALDPSLEERGFMPQLVGDNFVTKRSLLIAADNLQPGDTARGRSALFQTVQTLFVQTHHID